MNPRAAILSAMNRVQLDGFDVQMMHCERILLELIAEGAATSVIVDAYALALKSYEAEGALIDWNRVNNALCRAYGEEDAEDIRSAAVASIRSQCRGTA